MQLDHPSVQPLLRVWRLQWNSRVTIIMMTELVHNGTFINEAQVRVIKMTHKICHGQEKAQCDGWGTYCTSHPPSTPESSEDAWLEGTATSHLSCRWPRSWTGPLGEGAHLPALAEQHPHLSCPGGSPPPFLHLQGFSLHLCLLSLLARHTGHEVFTLMYYITVYAPRNGK